MVLMGSGNPLLRLWVFGGDLYWVARINFKRQFADGLGFEGFGVLRMQEFGVRAFGFRVQSLGLQDSGA